MTIQTTKNDTSVTLELEGRLDTATAPQLEAELKSVLPGVTSLAFDFSKLAYVSSAGLRVLLFAQKTMNKQGSMVLRNVSEEIMEVLDVTGFSGILTVE